MIQIDKTGSKPLYEQIVFSIKKQLVDGILSPGDRLPSVREMANSLLINPNTISKSYKLLEEENIIITIHGKGTFVKKIEDKEKNTEKRMLIKEKMEILLVEAFYSNISQEEVLKWVTDFSIK